MSFGELIGYIASILVFATFYVRTMIPLRMIAIASNFAFILYAFSENLIPVFILHTLLLPINIARLYEIKKLGELTRTNAGDDTSIDAIIPFMTPMKLEKGEVLFKQGDHSTKMYYVLEGSIRLTEIGKVIGQGVVIGEVGLFSPYRQRTATAVAETDCHLLSIDDKTLYQAYYQNPKLGFYLIRLISRRFAETYNALQAGGQKKLNPPDETITTESNSSRPTQNNSLPARNTWFSPSGAGRLTVTAFAIFSLALGALLTGWWYLHPYLGSVLNRDAAVTAWARPVRAPIEGQITSPVPVIGSTLHEQVNLIIENNQVSEHVASRALAEVDDLTRNIQALENHLKALTAIRDRFDERLENHKQVVGQMIERETLVIGDVIKALDARIELERRSQHRQLSLSSAGFSSEADVEAADKRLRMLEQDRAEKQKLLVQLLSRKQALSQGLAIDADGDELAWANNDIDALEQVIEKTKLDLRQARSALDKARENHAAELDDMNKARKAAVKLPAGIRVWQTSINPGQFVNKGETLATWIDCNELLVDVPLSDAEVALVTPGSEAEIVIEGETEPRRGTVRLVRGASARLGKPDLAASAKGHSPETGQVLVSISTTGDENESCPVGKAAWADFPDVTFLDVLRTRLRL